MDSDKYILIQLDKSIRNFHSHSWFHIGEFFMYRPSLLSIFNGCNKTAVIIPPSQTFFNMLNPMSVFFLFISLPVKNLDQAVLLNPNSIYETLKTNSQSVFYNIDINNNNFQYYSWSRYTNNQFKNTNCHILRFNASSIRYSSPDLPTSYSSLNISHRFGKYPKNVKDWLIDEQHDSDIIRQRVSYFCQNYNSSNILQNKFIKYYIYDDGILKRVNQLQTSNDTFLFTDYSYNSNQFKQPVTYSFEHSPMRLTVYQRDLNRHLHNLKASLQIIFELLDKKQIQHSINTMSYKTPSSKWLITVIKHDEETQPCDLQYLLRNTDFLLTTHGFQVMLLFFMKAKSTLLEIFPFRYYKETYFHLSKQFQINHKWLQNRNPTFFSRQILRPLTQEACMRNRRCRSYARGDDVSISTEHIHEIATTMHTIENETYAP